MAEDFYAELSADYDRMIRWERRLVRERPLFEVLWRRFHVNSVLDASCGTGHHLVLFRQMGLAVFGTDASHAMVKLARKTLEKAERARECTVLRSHWDKLPEVVERTFDAVLCIGNSLPYVTETEALHDSLRGLWSRVGEKGILLLQFKNFWKLRKENQRFLPLSWDPENPDSVAIRLYDYGEDRIDFNVILLDRKREGWTMRHQVAPLRPYGAGDVTPLLARLGAQVSAHGSLGLEDFDPDSSEDIVLLARRE